MYGDGVFGLGLVGDVVDLAFDDVGGGESDEVGDAAADAALEDEDVALDCQAGVCREVEVGYMVAFGEGDVVGGSVLLGCDAVVPGEGAVGGFLVFVAPVEEGSQLVE